MPALCGLPKKRLLACQAVLVLALSGVAGTTGATAAPTVKSDLGGDYVSFINALSHIASQNRSNCAKMATALKSYINSHHAYLESLQARSRKMTTAQKVVFGREYGSKLAAAIRSFTENVLACVTNADVQAALATVKKLNP
ncbi:MAG TPA: hypothetical protein VFB25_10185 [Gaiellaceae bacterium]|nr:hypothetical protein [Gaiellaceae bacterium]